MGHGDELRQGRRKRRQQAPAGFGDAQHGLGCGKAEVTHLSDGPATGHGIAVDGSNEGFPGPGKEAERLAPQAIAGACLDACSIIGCPLFEVAAGAKRPSCPSDNRHPRRVVLVITPQGVCQLLSELTVDGVKGSGRFSVISTICSSWSYKTAAVIRLTLL